MNFLLKSSSGASAVTLQVDFLPAELLSYMGTSLCPSCCISDPGLYLWPGREERGWPESLGPCIHVGDLENLLLAPSIK